METSTPETATLSDAVPLMVYGLGAAPFSVEPLAGADMVDDGTMPSAVVYENWYGEAMAFPPESVTEVDTVTVYVAACA